MFSDLSDKLKVSTFKIVEVEEYSAGIKIVSDESVEVEPSGAVGMILSIITVPLLRGVDE